MKIINPTIRPTSKQEEGWRLLRDNETRFILFGGGAEGGKSWLGAEWLLTCCYFYPGSKWFIGRNELTRLMASSFATFRKVCEHHKIPVDDWKFNGQYHYIEFNNGSRIDLLDLKYQPSDPMYQRYGSTEYTGGWIEEAGEVHFMAFDVLKSRVGRWKNEQFGLTTPKIFLTCNPEQNWLYRIFYKPYKAGTLPRGYAFVQSLYKDNPYTLKQSEERLNLISDPTLRARLKMGLWEYAGGDNALVSYDSIIDLFTNTIPDMNPLRNEHPQKYFSADVARYGSDKITFGTWRGLELFNVSWKVNRGIDQTAEDIKEILRREQIPYSHAIADDDGVGGGVVDNLRGIKGFTGNSSALNKGDKRENYGNLRSQCAFMLAEYINAHKIAITADIDETTKEMIIEELQQLKRMETNTEMALRIIPKDEIKEALGRSPDFSDMMMMRMYFEMDKTAAFKMNTNAGGIRPLIPGLLA